MNKWEPNIYVYYGMTDSLDEFVKFMNFKAEKLAQTKWEITNMDNVSVNE